jgi:hypothetical protein
MAASKALQMAASKAQQWAVLLALLKVALLEYKKDHQTVRQLVDLMAHLIVPLWAQL